MADFLNILEQSETEKRSMLCFGMDPVVERMQIDASKSLSDEITRYFSDILHVVKDKVSAVKTNVAFYLQYGHDGLSALGELIERAHKLGLPVIVDLKCGDIGRTSKAYAQFVFHILGGDAVTLNPLMGNDALEPFFSCTERGFFVLALTSNPGAAVIQLARLHDGITLSERLVSLICGWNRRVPSIGAVLGATQDEFERCIRQIQKEGAEIPLLIPGVGAQGGSYRKIERILSEHSYKRGVVRINASSAIAYAHERFPDTPPDEAAWRACEEILGQ
jgi:orotidine-5'-phosphate decarboxylase